MCQQSHASIGPANLCSKSHLHTFTLSHLLWSTVDLLQCFGSHILFLSFLYGLPFVMFSSFFSGFLIGPHSGFHWFLTSDLSVKVDFLSLALLLLNCLLPQTFLADLRDLADFFLFPFSFSLSSDELEHDASLEMELSELYACISCSSINSSSVLFLSFRSRVSRSSASVYFLLHTFSSCFNFFILFSSSTQLNLSSLISFSFKEHDGQFLSVIRQ